MKNKIATVVPMIAVFLLGAGFHYRWTCIPRDYGWCAICLFTAILNAGCVLWTVSDLQSTAAFFKRSHELWKESSKWWAKSNAKDSK